MTATVAAGGALLLAAGCGSTVQVRQSGLMPDGTGAWGLATSGPSTASGTPGSTASSGPAATPPSVAGPDSSGSPADGVANGLSRSPRTPVEVGVLVAKNGDAYYSSLGVKGVSTGDTVGEAKAVIKEVNATGGLGGHPVVPVFAFIDPTSTQTVSTQEQSACDTWTQDHHVVAVVTPLNTTDTLAACLTGRRVPQILSSFSVLTAATMRRYPLLSSPVSPLDDDAERYEIDSLHGAGWFRPQSATKPLKVGLVLLDQPDRHAVADHVVVPALSRYGIALTMQRAVYTPQSSAELGRTTADIQSAVLSFNTAGITHVLFLDQGGGLALLFGLAAHSNQYFPRYGYTSNSTPLVLQQNLPPEDLKASMGVGWVPSVDVIGPQLPAPSPAAARCTGLMRRSGLDVSDQSVRALAFSYCDALFLLKASMAAGPSSYLSGLSGLSGLGSTFRPALSLATDFSGGARAGVSQARDFAYDEACSCFAYTSGPRPMR